MIDNITGWLDEKMEELQEYLTTSSEKGVTEGLLIQIVMLPLSLLLFAVTGVVMLAIVLTNILFYPYNLYRESKEKKNV